ncbi:MAG: hypothetical protein R2862_04960 [Thermoanaerobaculia bacterium]
MGVSRRGNPLDDWRISPLSLVLSGLIRAIAATVSIRFHDDATIRQWERARRPFILAFWHRHLVLMRYAYRGMKMNVLVSQSWDGELTLEDARPARNRHRTRLELAGRRERTPRRRASGARGFGPGLHAGRTARSRCAWCSGGGPRRDADAATCDPGRDRRLALPPARELGPDARSTSRARVEIVYGEPLQFVQGEIVEEATARLGSALGAVEARAEGLATEPA